MKAHEFALEEFVLVPVTVESLKEDKSYAKTAKKYIKEYDGLQKRQNKERTNVANNQCKAMEKLAKSKKLETFLLLSDTESIPLTSFPLAGVTLEQIRTS